MGISMLQPPNIMIKLLLLLTLFAKGSLLDKFLKLTTNELRLLSQKELFDYFSDGSLKGYIDPLELDLLTRKLQDHFSQFITIDVIGSTYRNQQIKSVCVRTTYDPSFRMIVVGMLHGKDDLGSVNYLLSQLYNLLIRLSGAEPYAHRIMAGKKICVVPVLNFDTYQYISQIYNLTGQIPNVRKNRRSPVPCINPDDIGVDLQRNFQYQFGINNVGSSNLECNSTYRGPTSFSEAESIALHNFVLNLNPDNIFIIGGKGRNIIQPSNISSEYSKVVQSLAKEYSLATGSFTEIFNEEINGELCQNYAFASKKNCLLFNFGFNNVSNLTETLNEFHYIIVDFLKKSTSSLILSNVTIQDCYQGEGLCNLLKKNEKGLQIFIFIDNQGFKNFSDQLQLDLKLDQDGEFLYQIWKYQIVPQQQQQNSNNPPPKDLYEKKLSTYTYYTISERVILPVQRKIVVRLLLRQINYQYNYLNVSKTIRFEIELMNCLENGLYASDITTSLFKAPAQDQEIKGFVRNRAESYFLLIAFAAITFGLFFIWVIIKLCHLRQRPISNGISDEIHLNDQEKIVPNSPRRLAESRVNSQFSQNQFTKVTGSQRNSDSPTHHPNEQSSQNINNGVLEFHPEEQNGGEQH